MGGLGPGVLIVQSIAGLRHCGFRLGLSRMACLSLVLLVATVTLRVDPDPNHFQFPGSPYALASIPWAAAFFFWLKACWTWLFDPATSGENR